MSKGKRINPRRRPATGADVNRAKKEAQVYAIQASFCIALTALLDKGFLNRNQIKSAWNEMYKLSESINQGYINILDLKRMLLEEYDIDVSIK